MTERVTVASISVAKVLYDFVNGEVLPGLDIKPEQFWAGLSAIVTDLAPKNRALLKKRDDIQAKLDQWHQAHKGKPLDLPAYKAFLTEIGYLVPEGPDFKVDTANVDEEFATIAGPQLVVPITNARYALNAANARWGSLYDALYGTDVIAEDGGATRAGGYNAVRGGKVIAYAKALLDEMAPLAGGAKWADVTGLSVKNGALVVARGGVDGGGLAASDAFVGYKGDAATPTAVLLKHNGLHAEIVIDKANQIGASDPAGIADVTLEAAVSTIIDLEDSIAAVDPDDKVGAYRNWLGLMKGTLVDTFEKGGRMMTRRLNPDRTYTTPAGGSLTLHGRSMMLIRNTGHLMMDTSVLDAAGQPAPEGVTDGSNN